MNNANLMTPDASNQQTDFGHHASQWWDPQGPLRTLHGINPARLHYVEQRCKLADRAVLDLGCGGGVFAEALASHGARVTGADIAAELVEIAREHASQAALDIDYRLAGSNELLDENPGCYDVITCMEMLEHVDDPAAVIDDCARLLKPGGDLFLSTLNRTTAAYVFAIIGAEYVTGLLPRGTHDYRQFIRPAELAACCRQAGLSVRDISGLTYVPGLNRACISRSTAINYLLHARRPL